MLFRSSPARLERGYVADIVDTLDLGPSLARRDTVSFYVKYEKLPT